MPRVKRGVTARKKHKKVLNLTEGHWGARSRLIKTAHESMMKALAYAYRDRRNRKRDMRRLWITRINAATHMHDLKYSHFIQGLQLCAPDVLERAPAGRRLLGRLAEAGAEGAEVLEATPAVLERAADTQTPHGVVAAVPSAAVAPDAVRARRRGRARPLVLILDA